jgi:hypothetical protein
MQDSEGKDYETALSRVAELFLSPAFGGMHIFDGPTESEKAIDSILKEELGSRD